ncbi:hypothetical protein M011DRAFT_470307 [Sporormia fimetaria CBS 119925]|uniref:F-box domain-containing protein n=1 Tax=Sporormia fimetaria CBS 119925 TaxID=1340428 RepID=A0A6A6V3V8_9PLEO|nr:hypothetical protein M011DRAFT_470307 [Sporormia fimetaria CBS 119925]
MTTSCLPPELKLMIAEYLDPISSLQYAITCKENHSACNSILQKHKRLSAENQKLEAGGAGTLLFDKLKEILDDPRIGWYVRELDLPSGRLTYWGHGGGTMYWQAEENPNAPKMPAEYREAFLDAAQQLRSIYPRTEEQHVVDIIQAGIELGADDAVVAIMVHYLPMLKVLKITDLEVERCLYPLVKEVALGYGDPVRAPYMPFQRLEHAAVAHWDSEGDCDWTWARFLNCIPSLRAMVAMAMGGGDYREITWEEYGGELPKSNTKELFFLHSGLSVRAFQEILKGIDALERFSYEAGGATVSDEYFEPKRVIQALEKHQGHALEYLELEDHMDEFKEEDDSMRAVSFRGFKRLQSLTCSWDMIYPGDGSSEDETSCDDEDDLHENGRDEENQPSKQTFKIEEILPESIETLSISGSLPRKEWDRVRDHLCVPNDALPNLRSVRLGLGMGGKVIELRPRKDAESRYQSMWKNPLRSLLRGHGYT